MRAIKDGMEPRGRAKRLLHRLVQVHVQRSLRFRRPIHLRMVLAPVLHRFSDPGTCAELSSAAITTMSRMLRSIFVTRVVMFSAPLAVIALCMAILQAISDGQIR